MTLHFDDGGPRGGPADGGWLVFFTGIGCIGLLAIGFVLGGAFQAQIDAPDEREVLSATKCWDRQERQNQEGE